MSEKLANLGKWMSANAPQVGIGAAVVLLLGVGYYFYMDITAGAQPVPPPPVQVLNSRLSEDNVDFEIVRDSILESNPVIGETDSRQLVQMNMFDARSVQAQRERDQQFEEQVVRAEQEFSAGRLEEAMELVESVLEQNPLHHKATVLKNEIERAQQPEPAEPVEDPASAVDPMLNGLEGGPEAPVAPEAPTAPM